MKKKNFLTSMLLGGFVLASAMPAFAQSTDPLAAISAETASTVSDVTNQPDQLLSVTDAGSTVKPVKAGKLTAEQKAQRQTFKTEIASLRTQIKTNQQQIASLKAQIKTVNQDIKQMIQAKKQALKSKTTTGASILPDNIKTLLSQLKTDRAQLKTTNTNNKAIRAAIKQASQSKDFASVISGLNQLIQLQGQRVTLL